MSQTPLPFNRLPTELLHYVFNFAAAVSRHTCLNLCLVASWVRHIALPHLFRTVIVQDACANNRFTKFLTDPSSMPNFRAASFVNNVWTQHSRDLVLIAIEACDKITHLALNTAHLRWLIRSTSPGTVAAGVSKGISHAALARLRDLHLTLLDTKSLNLALTEHHNDDVTRKSPIFDKITHMRLTAIDDYRMRVSLDHFSRLSHFCLPYYDSHRHRTSLLESFLELQSLQMLVMAFFKNCPIGSRETLKLWVQKARDTDRRIYLVECQSVSTQGEWEQDMRCGDSIWDRAVRYTNEWEASRTHYSAEL
ncbi:hypothetical protein PILCRDRAFT_11615 [Piloderma croceum F 1598]|uniref:F-box domain-containing protein n=1 Tax=Piloderma croceum (strain F 1598) TaxID=765440 RepID=A0A0C3FDS0_PILCF|nr:hypothetical protein PILCRDRAFT_11615 [Piloderma croceum F 1598]